jgi:hypothetical protein
MTNALPWQRPHDIGQPEPAVDAADRKCRNCPALVSGDAERCEECDYEHRYQMDQENALEGI